MTIDKNLLFSLDEYRDRLEKVRAAMRVRQLDTLIIDQTDFLFYISGFGISENMYRACVVPLEGEPVFMLRSMDELPYTETTWLTQHVGFSDWQDPIEVLAQLLRERGWDASHIGLDGDSYCMTLNRFNRLKGALPQARFGDFSGVLEVLRARKSPAEIEYVRRAAAIGDIAISEALAVSGVGKSERDAAAAVSYAFMRHGADSGRAGPITNGVGDAFLHGNLHSRPLERGEILHMELLPFVNGYSARIMRPAVMGEASDAQQRIAAQLLEIQDSQFAAMRPGAVAKDIDAIARDAILAAGLRSTFPNITGYTLGYYPQSTPHTSDFTRVFLNNAEWVLEQGMIFHMYVSANGIAFSETVLVTDDGIDLLTRSPRRLVVV
ncbi:Xaa-Pro peptidase family protein [Caballeronia sp. LZ034LL]|uniref:M24 family metallopeptidase n=1 Tax=Caballeronia sp. LZ034LL TaxID=3038567 RepID=UPI00285D3ADF|nr:Xaa-Pro peptidase family protein [Caballeronia sp. LZ034LL]MDR5836258.1 Xaa-Pro peptidase family protein [Caballeronia sp. LZ034LL]